MIAAVLLQLLKQESIRGKKWKNTSRGSRQQDPLFCLKRSNLKEFETLLLEDENFVIA